MKVYTRLVNPDGTRTPWLRDSLLASTSDAHVFTCAEGVLLRWPGKDQIRPCEVAIVAIKGDLPFLEERARKAGYCAG